MPNGDPNWYREVKPELDAFFGQIAGVLEEFAARYNLTIEKYYHQGKNWTFRFRCRLGGTGSIQVNYVDSDHVMVGACWVIFDYDSATMLSKHTDVVKWRVKETNLRELLYKMLMTVLGWRRVDLAADKRKFTEWKEVPKADFEKRERDYPFPKIE
jgi:hypothetical protein